jgi:hypothetical protein
LFRLEPTDRCSEPGAECFLNLLLRPGAVQNFEGLSTRRQRDMNARSLFLACVLWDELHQKAFSAGFAVRGVKVHASRGILENKPCPPRFARQSPVTALLKKLQFELQCVQQVASIRWHCLSTSPGDRAHYMSTVPPKIPGPGFAICSIKISIDYLASWARRRKERGISSCCNSHESEDSQPEFGSA